MSAPTYVFDKHFARRKYANLAWWPDARFIGPFGRRHERKVTAWNLGWEHEQNETESGDEPSSCPWTKRTYLRQYEAGRRDWRHANKRWS